MKGLRYEIQELRFFDIKALYTRFKFSPRTNDKNMMSFLTELENVLRNGVSSQMENVLRNGVSSQMKEVLKVVLWSVLSFTIEGKT